MPRIVTLLCLVLFATLGAPSARADARTDARLENARQIFQLFTDLNEQAIPAWLLERAYGVAVVPDVIKGAFFVGGRGGKGVLSVRNAQGEWSHPVFITLGGVNVGFQWGVQSTDVILVFMSRRSVEGIGGGKVTLGADASVAAGPLGRSAAATTDAMLKAQVLSYSRSEGLFAGVALDGSVVAIDDKANASAYNLSGILPSQILAGEVGQVPEPARQFTAALTAATRPAPAAGAAPTAPATAPAGAPPGPPTGPAAPASTPAAAGDAAVQTYPMEDPNPGAPPPQ